MSSNYAVMDEDEMTYVEGGGYFTELAIELLWHACKSIFGEIAKKASFVAVPWSRVVATGLLVGIAAGYGYALYCICR